MQNWSRSWRHTRSRTSRTTHGADGWPRPHRRHAACPAGQSRWTGGEDLSWIPLRAVFVAAVGYDHMEGSRFRHTTQLKRWRPDREPLSCTYEQLDEPVGYDLAELLPGAPAAPASFTGSLEAS